MKRAWDLARTALRGWANIVRRVSFHSDVADRTLDRRSLKRRTLMSIDDLQVLWHAASDPTSCSHCETPLVAAHGIAVATTLGQIEEQPHFARGELWCTSCMALAAAGRIMLSVPSA